MLGCDMPERERKKRIKEKDVFTGRPVREFDDKKDLEIIDRSLQVSANRSKDKIYQLAKSNEWEWFTTFTFDEKKVDRFDYSACSKALSQWLNNMRKHSPNLAYLIVPECHKDGAFHFHGLFANCEGLKIKDTGRTVIQKWIGDNGRKRYRKTKDKIYIFDRYKFGWMTATVVKDNVRVTKYITKYVTKELYSSTFNKKRYWASRNLLLPNVEVEMIDSSEWSGVRGELVDTANYHKHIDVSQYANQEVDIFELNA